MKRRDFVRSGAFAAAFHHFPYHLYAGTKKQATDRVKLGPMKVELSRLAMGTGTNGSGGSSNQTKQLGVRGLADHFCAGFDQGITFWDTADQYGSHPHVREALKRTPREKVTILTKTHASTEAEMKADLDRFRRELGTDYLDIVLLHCMIDGDWPDKKRALWKFVGGSGEGCFKDARRLVSHFRSPEDGCRNGLGAGGPGSVQPRRYRHGCAARCGPSGFAGDEGQRQRHHWNENLRCRQAAGQERTKACSMRLPRNSSIASRSGRKAEPS